MRTRQLLNRNSFAMDHHRTNYAKFGPLNRMMTSYNHYSETIDLPMSRHTFRQHLLRRELQNNLS